MKGPSLSRMGHKTLNKFNDGLWKKIDKLGRNLKNSAFN